MHFRSHSATWMALAATLIVLAAPAFAQEEDLGTMANNALQAMRAGDWKKGLEINSAAIERYGKNAPLKLFGPKFGEIYYNKGICQLRLQDWQGAMASFESCYKDFPNTGPAAKAQNNYNKLALLKSGEAAMGGEEWGKAVTQFKKFLEERDKARDKFPQGAFYVNLAVSQFKSGKVPEGIDNFETALKNRAKFPTPDAAVIAGLQGLATTCIEKRDGKTLDDFIVKNRGLLFIEPELMVPYTPILLKLAGDALTAEMTPSALSLYQMIPSVEESYAATRARLKALGGLPGLRDGNRIYDAKVLEEQLTKLNEARAGQGGSDAIRLAAMGYLQESKANTTGAYASYLLLEEKCPKSPAHEKNLYALVRLSALAAPSTTDTLADKFTKEFPDSEYVSSVRKLQLVSLFADGQYDQCVEVASTMLPKLEKGTDEHDLCLHVLGGSYYYTGQYDKAAKLLAEHVDDYPKSNFAVASQYFQASNMMRLQFWEKAARLLDKFLSDHPDAAENPYLPFALYDRANCHFSQQEYDGARKNLERVTSEFSNSNSLDQAYNLLGNVEQEEGNTDKAKEDYAKGLEVAEQRGNAGVAGEALYYLVSMLGSDEKTPESLKAAVSYADKYWKDYAQGSPYQTRVAVAQVAAMDSVGRGDEALTRLQTVISTMAKDPEATGLEQVINSYTEIYLKNHTAEELKDHFYNFPGITNSDGAARALLRVAIIGVFEKAAKKEQDADKKRQDEALVKVLFEQLKTDFELKDLTSFILVKIGDYLRTESSNPREAVPYYNEVLARPEQDLRFNALLGRADVNGKSGNEAEINKAIEDFQRVVADSQEKKQKEFAQFRIVELNMAKGDYAEAAKQANIYFDKENNYRTYSGEVGYLLAQSFEKRKMVNDALAMYLKVWSGNDRGKIRISAPALKAWMELSFERNNPSTNPNDPSIASDRQGAYNGGAIYVEQMSKFKDKMSPQDLELFKEIEDLVKSYEARPEVKSLEVQREEQKKKK